jgi:hypothetical protein
MTFPIAWDVPPTRNADPAHHARTVVRAKEQRLVAGTAGKGIDT